MTRVWGALALAIVAVFVGLSVRPAHSGGPVWAAFTTLDAPRAFAQAVALPSGEILVLGGFDPNADTVVNLKSELIDPLTRRARVLPQPLLGRLHQTVEVVGEQVVVAGGVERLGDAWSPVDRVDRYDVRTRTWSLGSRLREPRSDHASVVLGDGRVLAIGGNRGTRLLASVEAYDVRHDRWSFLAPMPEARTQHTAVRLRDGRVLVAGGIDRRGRVSDTTFLYDPRTDTWTDGPRMMLPRVQHVAVPLPNGDVLFAGGDDAASGTSELYLSREDRFVPAGTLVEPRLVAQAAALPDGRVVLSGGLPPRMDRFAPLRSTELWDPARRVWSALPPAPTPRAWGILLFSDDALYLISGIGDDETPYAGVDRLSID